jgi:hypothetical protein
VKAPEVTRYTAIHFKNARAFNFSPTAIICYEIKDINDDEIYSEYVIYRNITKWNHKSSSSSSTMECPSLTQDMRDSLGILILIYSFFFLLAGTLTKIKKLRR